MINLDYEYVKWIDQQLPNLINYWYDGDLCVYYCSGNNLLNLIKI